MNMRNMVLSEYSFLKQTKRAINVNMLWQFKLQFCFLTARTKTENLKLNPLAAFGCTALYDVCFRTYYVVSTVLRGFLCNNK